nr:immunoglobulin heavy chain junction region [Macaca mulatta]
CAVRFWADLSYW